MTVLLILAAWSLLLWLILALCHAARLGDAGGRLKEPACSASESVPAVVSRAPNASVRREGYAGGPVAHAGGATG